MAMPWRGKILRKNLRVQDCFSPIIILFYFASESFILSLPIRFRGWFVFGVVCDWDGAGGSRVRRKWNGLVSTTDVVSHLGTSGLSFAVASGFTHPLVFNVLWKGVGPAMVRAGALTASQLATYDESKRIKFQAHKFKSSGHH